MGILSVKRLLVVSCLLLCRVCAWAQDSVVVFFPFNSAVLPDTAQVDSLGHMGARCVLAGYCDSIGSDRYNDSLAGARIAAVRRRLIRAGLPDSLVQVEVYGKRAPLNDNATPEKRAANRRVTIHWTSWTAMPPAVTDTVSMIELAPSMSLTELLKDSSHTVGSRVILRGITFYGGRHYPEPSSYKALRDLLRFMGAHPGINIEIQGFVCCLADSVDALDLDTYIINLSEARAKFVFDYLKGQGIDPARMRYRGFQASQKLYPAETSEEERKLNRRVQIKITAWREQPL